MIETKVQINSGFTKIGHGGNVQEESIPRSSSLPQREETFQIYKTTENTVKTKDSFNYHR